MGINVDLYRLSWRSSVKNSRQEPTPSNGSLPQSMAAPPARRVLGMRTRSFNKTGFDWLIDWLIINEIQWHSSKTNFPGHPQDISSYKMSSKNTPSKLLTHFPVPRASELTHWGRVTHICVSKLTIIGSDNGLLPDQRQVMIWTNAGILLNGPLGTNFSETLIEIYAVSFRKMHLKLSSGKWQPFFTA